MVMLHIIGRISPRFLALHLVAALCWALLLSYCQWTFYSDPASYFFDPHGRRAEQFARARQAEVDAHISAARDGTLPLAPPGAIKHWPKRLCVGIVSDSQKRKHTEVSLQRTLASLGAGLGVEERDSMHVVVLLSARDAKSHFAFGKDWLPLLADQVLAYRHGGRNATDGAYQEVEYEVNHGNPPRRDLAVERARLDKLVVMEACRETQASYMALVEPDIVARREWYLRLWYALVQIESAARKSGVDWAYLRLFNPTEGRWMWARGDWVFYSVKWVVMYSLVVVGGLSLHRWGCQKKGAPSGKLWQEALPALSLGVWIPVFVKLLVLAGGMVAFRRHYAPEVGGLRDMAQDSCCGHGIVLAQTQLHEIAGRLRKPPFDFSLPTMLDGLAEQKGLSRWTIDKTMML